MAKSLLANRNLVLAKLEAAVGVDSDPTAAADAMQVSDLDLTPFEATEIDRGLYKAYLGASPVVHDAVHQSLRFGVEIAGSGAVGTAPPYDALLRACGFASSVVAVAAAVAASVEWDGITFTADDAGAAGNRIRLQHGVSRRRGQRVRARRVRRAGSRSRSAPARRPQNATLAPASSGTSTPRPRPTA